ncbi:MAG: 1-(5-phosphoribosyl)-5-[Oscillibacter sp.]|nr:1-(5-phosphoribosyl)-5-[(5-phosphoribosylamino)methylideneamino]imidazole-4-carboxamide isomerase [Oscillibacter sp.]
MRIFPAIDLIGGQAVRLYQGDYDRKTVCDADPCAAARRFREAGATCLHVVDLDGAREGSTANFAVIEAIAKQGGFYMEVGGGIRTEERIRQYLDIGVNRCILGTAAVKDFDFAVRMGRKYGDKIAVGADTRNGFLAVRGWMELSTERGFDFCKHLVEHGIRDVIYTDISRDGAQRGTNLELYRELLEIRGLRLTASGGVGSLEELRALRDMGAYAAILGKALYAGQLDLREVMEEAGLC